MIKLSYTNCEIIVPLKNVFSDEIYWFGLYVFLVKILLKTIIYFFFKDIDGSRLREIIRTQE